MGQFLINLWLMVHDEKYTLRYRRTRSIVLKETWGGGGGGATTPSLPPKRESLYSFTILNILCNILESVERGCVIMCYFLKFRSMFGL